MPCGPCAAFPTQALRRRLREARNFGLDTLDHIIASRTDFDYDFRKDYLGWHIHYPSRLRRAARHRPLRRTAAQPRPWAGLRASLCRLTLGPKDWPREVAKIKPFAASQCYIEKLFIFGKVLVAASAAPSLCAFALEKLPPALDDNKQRRKKTLNAKTPSHSAASRNQRRNGRKGTQGSQKSKQRKFLSMCSLRSFVAKLCQKSKTFRDSTAARQAATKSPSMN